MGLHPDSIYKVVEIFLALKIFLSTENI